MQHRLRCVNHIFRQSGFARSAHRNGIIPGVAKDPATPGQLGSARHSSRHQTQSPTPIKRISRNFKGRLDIEQLSPAEAAKYYQARTEEQLGVFSGDVAQTFEDIKTGKQEIASGTVSLQKIRICILGEYRWLAQIPRKERSAVHQERGPLARTILELLWQDNRSWMNLIIYDGECGVALCYLGIAEKLQDFLTRWLKADAGNDQTAPGLEGWRGKLFRHIVNALLMHNTNYSADAAIQYFFEFSRLKTAAYQVTEADGGPDRYGIHNLSLRPALRLLSRELATNPFYRKTDPSLYSQFAAYVARFHDFNDHQVLSRAFCLAGMALLHPTESRPDGMLKIMRTNLRSDSTPDDLRKFEDMVPVRLPGVLVIFEKLHETLCSQGRTADAEWVSAQIPRLEALGGKVMSKTRSAGRIRRVNASS